jgi:hypothetical protein
MRFRPGRRRGCIAMTVAGGCRLNCSRRSGLASGHFGRAPRSGAFTCTATTAAPPAAPASAARAAFRALGAAFRRRWCGGSPRCVLTGRVGGAAVAVMAIDDLAPSTVAVTRALGRGVAPALRGSLLAATAVAVAIPIGVIPPTIPITTLAAASALASGAIGIA